MKNFYKKDTKSNKKFIRVNFQIKVPSVRVVKEGQQLGVMTTDAARKLAYDEGLDLVEIVPTANPPVCSILSYDKYRYELNKKEKETKKNQKSVETKEIKLRPCTHEHDVNTKVASVKRFIADGKKVNLTVEFKKREIMHKDSGLKVMNDILAQLKDLVEVESNPKFEGSRLTCRVSPKKVEEPK